MIKPLKIYTFSLVLVAILFSSLCFAQVGINTTSPGDGSMLDVTATDKGILIPRVDITNLNTIAPITYTTAAEVSLLVYNTNITSGVGFYSWNGTQWVALSPAEDGDFHEVGTSTAPTEITTDVFRTGNVGIGNTTPDYPLEISTSPHTRAINTSVTGSGSTKTYSTYNGLTNATGTGEHIGIKNNIAATHIGVQNQVKGTGNVKGVYKTFNNNAGDGLNRGMENQITNNGNGDHQGVYTSLSSTGSGKHTGMSNYITNTGNGIKSGVIKSNLLWNRYRDTQRYL